MRRALIAGALAACSNDAGIAFEIATPPDTRFVELFVAPAECAVEDDQGNRRACAIGVGWHPTFDVIPGKVFSLDAPRVDDGAITIAAVDGDRAVIRLQAPEPITLSRVVLVGYTDDPATAPDSATSVAVLHHLEVPTGDAERWSITLEPASLIPDDPRSSPATPKSVRVWRRPGSTAASPTAACLAVQDGAAREFLVPGGDLDCDAQQPECRPEVANGMSSGTDLNCPLASGGGGAPQCFLGNLACTDGVGSDGACSPLANPPVTCVPDAVCDPASCAGPFDSTCLRSVLAAETYTGPHFACTLAFDPDAGAGDNLCTSSGLDRVSLSLVQVSGNTICTGISFGPVSVPVQFGASGMLGIEPGLTWSVEARGGCVYELRVEGRHDPGAPTGQVSTVLAAFDRGPTTRLVVPVRFAWRPLPGCDGTIPGADPFGCTPVGFDAAVSPFTCMAE